MKSLIFISVFFINLIIAQSVWAMNPFWYNSTAYSSAGVVQPNLTAINVRMTVTDGSSTYSSYAYNVKTDQYGAFSVRVGRSDTATGDLGSITLSNKTKLKIEISLDGTNYNVVSENLLLSSVMESNSTSNPTKFNWFFMPSIDLDTSNPDGTSVVTVDLYDYYKSQFASPAVKSPSAPTAIPNFPVATDLYYYVTGYDANVFDAVAVSDSGVLTYKVKAPATSGTYMNIIFVLK